MIHEQIFKESVSEDKTDIRFGISMGFRSFYQGVRSHFSYHIKGNTIIIIEGRRYVILVSVN